MIEMIEMFCHLTDSHDILPSLSGLFVVKESLDDKLRSCRDKE